MITLWLIYATLVAIGVAAAARTVDHLCRVAGRAARMVWAVAVCIALVAPVVLAAVRSAAPRAFAEPVGIISRGTTPSHVSAAPRIESPPRTPHSPRGLSRPPVPSWLDPLVLRLWAAVSVVLLLSLAVSVARTARRRRTWRSAVVDGTPVYVSDDVGPALVGLVEPRIVVPEWVLGMPQDERKLVLTHEREHAHAADPLLLAGATVAVVCAPWNVGLWYMLGRLRLAVEVDCDRRVLRQHTDVRRYCTVLLDVGEQAINHPVLSTALTRPKSDLRRRLEQMTVGPQRLTAARLAAGAALTGSFLFLSCRVPTPPAPAHDTATSAIAARKEVARSQAALAPDASDDSLVAQLQAQLKSIDAAVGEPHSQALAGVPDLSRVQETGADASLRRLLHTHARDDSLVAQLQVAQLQAQLKSIDAAVGEPHSQTLAGVPDLSRLQDTGADAALRRLLHTHLDSLARSVDHLWAKLDGDSLRMRDAIQRHFPEQLATGQHTPVGLWFLVDADGAVVRTKRTAGTHPPSISAYVVAVQFSGVAAESIDEVRILSGRAVGVQDSWVVWAVLQRGAALR